MKLPQTEINWCWKNYDLLKKHSKAYRIQYETEHSSGIMEVDTLYYQRNIKKFKKLFEDCRIIKFEEVEKPELKDGKRYD